MIDFNNCSIWELHVVAVVLFSLAEEMSEADYDPTSVGMVFRLYCQVCEILKAKEGLNHDRFQ